MIHKNEKSSKAQHQSTILLSLIFTPEKRSDNFAGFRNGEKTILKVYWSLAYSLHKLIFYNEDRCWNPQPFAPVSEIQQGKKNNSSSPMPSNSTAQFGTKDTA